MTEYELPEKSEIFAEYNSYNSVLTCIMYNIENKLQEIIKLSTKPVYKARIKSFDSYYKKLLRLKPKDAAEIKGLVCLTDMIGIRIICAFLEDLYDVESQIKKYFKVKEIEHKGADQSVREFGYESIHILIEIPAECKTNRSITHKGKKQVPDNLVCEIQVRTILQDAWAEVEHELIYKTEFTPFDMPLRRKLASINASLSLADIIFQEIRDYQKKLQKAVEERRESFYLKADKMTDLETIPKKAVEKPTADLSRVSPYVYGTIDDMILSAIQAHNEGNLDEAVKIYSTIITQDKDVNDTVLSVIFKHRGMAYFAQNMYQEALNDFKESETRAKNNFRAVYYEGIVYSVLNQNDKALECFNRSLEMNELQSHAFYRRALIYYNTNEYQKSMEDLNAAEKLGLKNEECEVLHKKLLSKFDMNM